MRGRLIVVSGPSGSGKTTIAQALLHANPELAFSISATTRPIRPGEQHGKDYYFLTKDEFLRWRDAGAFVEWEELFGNLYGTPVSEVERALQKGKHLLFDVDVKGALSIKRRYPEAVLIFVAPPSPEILQQRLRNRRTEDETMLAARLARAAMELELGKQFDYSVVNDDRARAITTVQAIVKQHLQSP
jgi:guanylate kinase